MNRFVTIVSDDLYEYCHSCMLHDNMKISLLMVHGQQMEEARANRKSRNDKKERSSYGCSSKSSLDIQDKPMLQKRFYTKVFSKFPIARDDCVSNTKPKKVRDTSSQTKKAREQIGCPTLL